MTERDDQIVAAREVLGLAEGDDLRAREFRAVDSEQQTRAMDGAHPGRPTAQAFSTARLMTAA